MSTSNRFFLLFIISFILAILSIPVSAKKTTLNSLDCSTDEVAKWNGSAWICAEDVDTTDSDWNSLENIPDDIADGDDDTSAISKCLGREVLLANGDCLAVSSLPENWFAPRVVFVTPIIYDGNLGGLVGANEICNNHALAPDSIVPPGDYVAILSNTRTSASSQAGISMGPIVNSLGAPVAENVTTLFSSIVRQQNNSTIATANPLASTINRMATGGLVLPRSNVGTQTWTGSQSNGQPASDLASELCDNWTTSDASKTGKGIGLPWWRVSWLAGEELTPTINQFSCHLPKGIFCIQRL